MTSEKIDVWMPLYIGDWIKNTRHLTPEQDGCYFRLICQYWSTGFLLDDDVELASIVGLPLAKWKAHRQRIAKFFVVSDGKWTHTRCDKIMSEWINRKARASEKAARAARGRWKGDKSDASSMLQAKPQQCASTSSATLSEPTAHLSASGSRFSNLDLRAKAVERMGPEWVASWLDPCSWRDLPTPAIVCRNSMGVDRVKRELRPLLNGISVEMKTECAA